MTTINEAMASAYVDRRHAQHLLDRAATRALELNEYEALLRERDEAAARLERLVQANAAHELEWCHDSRECPICTGEVSR